MKPTILAFAALVSLSQSTTIFAQVDMSARYARWEQRLPDRVNQQLSYPPAAERASGDVFVVFRIGADGRPFDVAVRHSSGYEIFDRAAVRLVSRLGRLGRVPSAAHDPNEIMLKLSYGDGTSTAAGTIQVARADRQEQLANERRNRALVSASTQVAQSR